jgi:hypothetical protein
MLSRLEQLSELTAPGKDSARIETQDRDPNRASARWSPGFEAGLASDTLSTLL